MMWGFMLQTIKEAKVGEIVPVFKSLEGINPLEYFEKLSDYGRLKNCILFETKHGIVGSADPCLKITGKQEQFEITALNNLGRKFLTFLKGDFKFADKVHYGKNRITGNIKSLKKNIDEHEKLFQKTHLDVLRTIAFKFKPTSKPIEQYGGLFGAFSYDFVEHFESMPEKDSEIKVPYYEFYFLDNLFVTKDSNTFIIANALIMGNKKEKTYEECIKTLDNYENVLKKKIPKVKSYKSKEQTIQSNTEKEEYEAIIQNIKRNILEGDLYQAFPSRFIISNYNAEPLDIFKSLRKNNYNSYYLHSEEGILLGTSPEMNLKVDGDNEKFVEVRLLAGTRPTAKEDNDGDLENRYETELKTDFREISKHIMSIDSERSNIARISKLGSRHIDQLFVTKKFPDEQHLVSSIKGTLKEDHDALHVFQGSLNKISGIPKIRALKLLSQFEKDKRGYSTGSFCFLNPHKDFFSTTITDSIQLLNKKAYIGVYSDIIFDSIAEDEYNQTENNCKECLKAIKSAGGLK